MRRRGVPRAGNPRFNLKISTDLIIFRHKTKRCSFLQIAANWLFSSRW